MSTRTPDYPVAAEFEVLPGQYDLRVEMEDGELCLTLHQLRAGRPLDDETATPDTVCRRYVTTDLGDRDLAYRKRNCDPDAWVDTWLEVRADTAEQVAATLVTQEPHTALHQHWIAAQAAEMVAEVTR